MKKWYLMAYTVGLCVGLTGCWTTQEGVKNGVLTKIAKEGKYWGTYEGELIRGGLEDGSGASGRSFQFTLGQRKNKQVIKALELMERNKPVSIKYHCERFTAPWRGESKCFLDGINE